MTYGKPIDYDATRDARHFSLAREILRRENATPDQITAALDVLAASTDWQDVMLVREMRIGMFAQAGAELRTPGAARATAEPMNFIPDFPVRGGAVVLLLASGVFTAGIAAGLLVSRMGWL